MNRRPLSEGRMRSRAGQRMAGEMADLELVIDAARAAIGAYKAFLMAGTRASAAECARCIGRLEEAVDGVDRRRARAEH